MFLTDRKLERRIAELKEHRYRDIINLNEFTVQEDTQGVVNPVLPEVFTGWDTLRVGDTWKGRDLFLWMHREIQVPAEWKGKKIVGVFDFGNTGAGNNAGFESMLYLNGKMYQGVDANHKEVFFDDTFCGTNMDVTFRLWSGLEGGGVPTPQEHRIARADLAWLDEEVDDFYYLASMVWETIKELDEFNPVQHDLRKALDTACHCIDWAYPGSDTFYESVHEADHLLNESIDSMDKKSSVNIRCVGHTHIDVAWLWRLKHTREKCSRSFTTVLRLMEQYPEYVFLQTQPQLYEYMKEEFPDIYKKIKERVAEGRWEADGAMWVEADCNLTSGESLTRQILLGSKFIKDEFGKDVEYLWLPDVFGYSWALPQILKKAGINTFMTTKISWNQYNRMPHDTFKWKGIDVNLLFSYKLGRHVLNAGRGASVGTILRANTAEMMVPILADLDKVSFWQKPGDNTDFPINELENGKNNFATNLKSNVEKINYLKLKSISIGYTLPVFPKQSKHYARVFMSVENVFTITNSSSPDPESIDIVTGVDSNNNYPLATRYTLGLTLNL